MIYKKRWSHLVMIVTMAVISFGILENSVNAQNDQLDKGDVDGNSRIELLDAKLALEFSLGIGSPTEKEIQLGDMDYSGSIDLKDAQIILKKALGIEVIIPEASVKPQPVLPQLSPLPTRSPKPTLGLPDCSYEQVVTGMPIQVDAEYEKYSNAVRKNVEGNQEKYLFKAAGDCLEKNGLKLVNPFKGQMHLREELASVISYEAEPGKTNVWSISELFKTEGWPAPGTRIDERLRTYMPEEVTYTIPQWNTGVSISFWAKLHNDNGRVPLLVLAGRAKDGVNAWYDSGMLLLCADGSVRFTGNRTYNSLVTYSTTIEPLGQYGEWNHYTITIANDWIQVYINGRENLFDQCAFDLPMSFNGDFMTRYHSITERTQEEIDAMKGSFAYYYCNWIGTDSSMIRNGSFWGAHADETYLIMDFITDENTTLWIGGTETESNLQWTEYKFEAEAEVTDMKYYMQELTPEQVASNYKYLETKPKD